MPKYVLTACGNAAHNVRTAMWTSVRIIHVIHTSIYSKELIKRFYTCLHTTCTQVSYIAKYNFTAVNCRLYTFYTAPTITTKYI